MDDNEQLKLVVAAVLDEKLVPIKKDLDEVKTKLGNHFEHFAYQFTDVKNDVAWLKKFFDPEKAVTNDVKQAAEIGWLKWAVRLIIGGTIANTLAMAYQFFIK